MKLRTCHCHFHRHCHCHRHFPLPSPSSSPFCNRAMVRLLSTLYPSLHQLQSKFHIKRHRNIHVAAVSRNRWCAIPAIRWPWRSCDNARCICRHRNVQAAVRLGCPSSPPGNKQCHTIWHT